MDGWFDTNVDRRILLGILATAVLGGRSTSCANAATASDELTSQETPIARRPAASTRFTVSVLAVCRHDMRAVPSKSQRKS